MSYQVLARKWRPRTFQDVVGQEHVLRALINALDRNQVHHAFLFTGTRGVGKTTIARILARALNCEAGISATPCGECASCRELDEGRFIDLIEVDAASRTKVEDTRELLENVQYAPTRGRFKIYLIDEVHMLSTHSFNALLKTLEEPPSHVKFLLATTDPQRLPVTILSRCLQFNLKRLPLEMIRDHLAQILESEGVSYEVAALTHLARAAAGSVRDALSLLDQGIAYGSGGITEADVRAMLGTIEQEEVVALVDGLAAQDAAGLLACVQRLAERSADFLGVLEELLTLLHRIALAQAVPEALDDSEGDRALVLRLAQSLSQEDVQLYYQIGLMGRRDVPLGPDPRSGLEMTLLRMLAFRPAEVEEPARDALPARSPDAKTAAGGGGSGQSPARQAVSGQPRREDDAVPGGDDNAAATVAPDSVEEWAGIIDGLKLNGMARELVRHCALVRHGDDELNLVLPSAHKHLHNKKLEERVQQALQAYYGSGLRIKVIFSDDDIETPAAVQRRREEDKRRSAQQAIEGDANVQTFQDVFNASIVPDSIRPVD